ncbi:MAG: hypothetical protein KAJ19_14630, partial [Gammaproteobacteria bacterium]|nr:hypothetical protein [Gammaproteobacteria bacterium]
QAESDGRALRYAIVAGANTALHYFGEGEATNYATAKEMGEPTTRYYTERQNDIIIILHDIISLAHARYLLVTSKRAPKAQDLKLQTTVTEVARADNAALATAAKDVVGALAEMKANGWIDDPTAARLAFKFAGEQIDEEEIARILEAAVPPEQPEDQKENESEDSE